MNLLSISLYLKWKQNLHEWRRLWQFSSQKPLCQHNRGKPLMDYWAWSFRWTPLVRLVLLAKNKKSVFNKVQGTLLHLAKIHGFPLHMCMFIEIEKIQNVCIDNSYHIENLSNEQFMDAAMWTLTNRALYTLCTLSLEVFRNLCMTSNIQMVFT